MICLEIYKVKTPFSSLLLIRDQHSSGVPKRCKKEITGEDASKAIRLSPSALEDLEINSDGEAPTGLARLTAEIFIGTVLCYPKGEYQALLDGKRIDLVPWIKGAERGIKLSKCKQLFEIYPKNDESGLKIYDIHNDGGWYRIALCDSVEHLDIEVEGARILRAYNGRSVPVCVAAVSRFGEYLQLKARYLTPDTRKHFEPYLFSATAEALAYEGLIKYPITLLCEHGSVRVDKDGGYIRLIPLDPSVSRHYQ